MKVIDYHTPITEGDTPSLAFLEWAQSILSPSIAMDSYTVAQLAEYEPASPALAFCTDETGGAVPVFWDGSDWRRMTDRAVAS